MMEVITEWILPWLVNAICSAGAAVILGILDLFGSRAESLPWERA